MAEKNSLVAAKRNVSGSANARRLRGAGKLPCMLNESGGESRLLQIDHHNFDLMLQHHRSENMILDLEVDGEKSKKVLIKEVQHDPVSGDILHADFVEVSMTKKMRVHIPLVLVGEAVGVTQQGGILDHLLRELEVECLPTDLPDGIDVDVSALEIGNTILVGAVKVDPKLTVLTAKDVAVAGVSAPAVEEEPVPEEAVEGAEGQPEVIGEKKEEGDDTAKQKPDDDKKSSSSEGAADSGKGKK